MKFLCIDNSGDQKPYMTKGKIYDCEEDGEEYWLITNDFGDDHWSAYKWRFKRIINISKNIKIL